MNSIIKRLLIFTLFVTLSLGADIRIVEFNGTLIGGYPTATQVTPSPFYWTGFPGPAFISITAVSSVAVCVSPYAAITSNLAQTCPHPLNFYYTNSPENEFLLFLDDFSMNFMGQDGRSNKNKDLQGPQVPPYQPQSAILSLLQDVPYYVTIGLIDNFAANSTELEILDFTLTAQFPQCPAGTVPNPEVTLKTAKDACIPLQSELTPTNSSSAPLTVNLASSVVFSFQITSLSYSANLDFHIHSLDYNLTVYFGYGYVPNSKRYDFMISNSSVTINGSDISAEFLGDLIQSFSVNILNPKVGTYYAQIFSSLLTNTDFDIEFNTTVCDIENGQCGPLTIPSSPSGEMTVQNITLTSDITYLSILGQGVQFGLTTGTGANAFVQVDVNAIPPGVFPYNSYIQFINDTISLQLNSFINQTYVIGLLNADVLNQDTAPVVALVWTGSICPNNCGGVGTCDVQTLQCDCDSSHSGAYCQIESSPTTPPKKKKLSTLYIILIIIGGAILLAVLIGVPVALFLNNRKKARYERV